MLCLELQYQGTQAHPSFLGVLDTVFSNHAKHEVVRYLSNMQNTDGGFGLHIEGHSTMFGTVLRYRHANTAMDQHNNGSDQQPLVVMLSTDMVPHTHIHTHSLHHQHTQCVPTVM